jgi:hypothetical protein
MDNSNALSSEEKRILEELRENPQLLECVLELTEISGNKIGGLKLGDDAEEATVNAIQKTGKAVLEGWAGKRHDEAKKEWKSVQDCREHEKKSLLANLIGSSRD